MRRSIRLALNALRQPLCTRSLLRTPGESDKPRLLCRGCSSQPQQPQQSVLSRLLQWVIGDRKEDHTSHIENMDFYNCGGAFGRPVPQPELVNVEGMERGSFEWCAQFYGAALYWHMASTLGETHTEPVADFLTNKDVLEVGCTRGGGARFLAAVTKPMTYVATDISQEHIDACRASDCPPGLSFEVVDAAQLHRRFQAASFDVILCVQTLQELQDRMGFLEAAAEVLRPNGHLAMCDALTEKEMKSVLAYCSELGMDAKAVCTITKNVSHIGLCRIHRTREYYRLLLQKRAL